MRSLLFVPLLALAACGEGEQKAKAPPRPNAIEAGQWESTLEVTHMRPADEGRPRLNWTPGTRLSGGACVGADAVSRPPPDLFVGEELEDCEYGNFHMRAGRINTQLSCRRDGLQGEIGAMLDARFTPEGFEGTLQIATLLVTDGDVVITTRISGRRTGQCSSPDGRGNEANASRGR